MSQSKVSKTQVGSENKVNLRGNYRLLGILYKSENSTFFLLFFEHGDDSELRFFAVFHRMLNL